MNPDDPHADQVGIGDAACSCGAAHLSAVRASGCEASVRTRCPFCGDVVDVLAVRG